MLKFRSMVTDAEGRLTELHLTQGYESGLVKMQDDPRVTRPGRWLRLWQVSGRSDLTWEEAIRLDLYYVDNWSMLQDLSILTKTVSAVFRSDGAY